jgi:hypothetical protein
VISLPASLVHHGQSFVIEAPDCRVEHGGFEPPTPFACQARAAAVSRTHQGDFVIAPGPPCVAVMRLLSVS